MPETLLGATTIHLFGRVVADLTLQFHEPSHGKPPKDASGAPPPRLGGNNFLMDQLFAHVSDAPELRPRFARVYCFAYEGTIYDLLRPQIFLVHGEGTLAEGPVPGTDKEQLRYSRAPGKVDRTGTAGRDWSFAIIQTSIDLITDDPKIMFFGKDLKLLQIFSCGICAGRVRGIVQDDGFRLGSQSFQPGIEMGDESIFGWG